MFTCSAGAWRNGRKNSIHWYSKQLQFDYARIDGSLVRGMATNPIDHKMVRAIYQMANPMNIETVAESVENEETDSMLQEIGVDYVQGFSISRPEPWHIEQTVA